MVSVVATSLVDECYRRAQEAKRAAEAASMPSQKTHFLDLQQRWLRAAESVAQKNVRETNAPIAPPTITTPDVDQPLQGVQEKDFPVPRRAEEIGDEQARGANLALTMQYGGLERRSRCAFQMKILENWRSRQSSAKLALVNSWACLSRPRWHRTFLECSIRSPRTSQNKNAAVAPLGS